MKTLAGHLIPRTSVEDYKSKFKPMAVYPRREFKSSAESFRCAAGYPKLRHQTGCSNQPR